MLAALLLVCSAAVSAMTIQYTTATSQTLALRGAPVVWVAGPDSSGNSFVAAFALSDNATYYTITLKPVAEAQVTWSNLTTIENQDTAPYAVTITGDSVAAYAKVLDFRMEVRSYGTDALVGTLDFRDAAPSASLGTMAAGAKWYTKLWAELDTGTGSGDLPGSVDVTLSLTA